jgi:hypothetical protein
MWLVPRCGRDSEQSLVAQVNGIPTIAAQPSNDTPGNTHICEKPH